MALQRRNPFENAELEDLIAVTLDDEPVEPVTATVEGDDEDDGEVIDLRAVHHVGIAVADLDDALAEYRTLFGATVLDRGVVADEEVEVALVDAGGSRFQLLAATTDDSWVAELLDDQRSALSHVGLAVDDVAATLAALAERGWERIDAEPQDGLGGRRTAYVHPPDQPGTLLQLVQEP